MKKIKLTEICNPKQWKTIPTSDLQEDGYPVYGANGVIGYYSEYNHENETIAITCRGATCGSINITEPKSYVTGNAMCIDELRDDISVKYLYYCLKNYDFNKVISGSAQPQITRQNLEKVNIAIGSSEEQQEIVNILDNVSSVIDKRKMQVEKLDTLIKCRFVEMFGTLQDTIFNITPLGGICEFIKDGTHQTPIYTEDRVNGFKFLSSKDVKTGKIDWTNIKYIPKELHEELYKRIAPKRDDILLAKNGTTGIAAIVDTDEIFDIYVSLALLRFKVGNNPKYLLHAINSIDTKRQFDESLKGVGVPNLHLGEIKKTKIIIPPIDLQDQFTTFVQQVDKLKIVVQKSLDETQVLFDSLMQKYFE